MTRFLLMAALVAPAFAQPKFENAKLETRAVNGSLNAAFYAIVSAQVEPAWIGYSVAQVAGERSACATVDLEGAPEFILLYRVADRQVEKIRTYGTDCNFDAGNLPVYWLSGVDGGQSAALLATFIPASDGSEGKKSLARQRANNALSAIARHRDGVPVLIELARRTQLSSQTRQEVVRTLGRSKDPRATKFFQEILATR